MYFICPVIFGDFDNFKMEVVRGQTFKGVEEGVRVQSPLLDEGTRNKLC